LKSLLDQHVGMLCFYENSILTEGMFVTQLSVNVGISVWRCVWVTTNCCFMGVSS